MKYFLALLLTTIIIIPGSAQSVEKLPPAAFKQKMEEHAGRQLIDVRTPEEFAKGYIMNARNVNVYDKDFGQQIDRLALDRDEPVFVYCKAGGRSANAVKQLRTMGFKSIFDLQGGLIAWEDLHMPLSGEQKAPADSGSLAMADFKKMLSSNKLVVVNFFAPWCAPCKEMAPLITKLAKEYEPRVIVHRIDYDAARTLCRQLSVDNIPTILVFRGGKEIKRTSGLQSEQELETLMKL